MLVQKKPFIRISILLSLSCLMRVNVADEIFNRIEPQNLQFMPQPFYVTYNAVPVVPEKTILQKIGNGFLNAMNRLRTRTRVVYGGDPNESSQDSDMEGPFQRRKPLIQRFRERVKDRRTISTTTSEAPLQYYGALSTKFQMNTMTAASNGSTTVVS